MDHSNPKIPQRRMFLSREFVGSLPNLCDDLSRYSSSSALRHRISDVVQVCSIETMLWPDADRLIAVMTPEGFRIKRPRVNLFRQGIGNTRGVERFALIVEGCVPIRIGRARPGPTVSQPLMTPTGLSKARVLIHLTPESRLKRLYVVLRISVFMGVAAKVIFRSSGNRRWTRERLSTKIAGQLNRYVTLFLFSHNTSASQRTGRSVLTFRVGRWQRKLHTINWACQPKRHRLILHMMRWVPQGVRGHSGVDARGSLQGATPQLDRDPYYNINAFGYQ